MGRSVRSAIVGILAGGAVIVGPALPASARDANDQPVLTTRSVPIITVAGRSFRDLNRDGKLTPYEDWRRTPQRRADDLLRRMTLEQKAGLMVHGLGLPSTATGYDLAAVRTLVAERHMTTFITRLAVEPRRLAEANNAVQALAEAEPLGIPAVISTDPRNGFAVTAGQTVARVGATAMPDPIGMAATGSPALTRRLADIARQEYRAVGIQMGLSPQADIATEPRWTRINGTFGSDPATAGAHVRAYVEGMQGGSRGPGPTGVATVTKHWAGYGAQANGYDSHYFYGRYAVFPGDNFAAHLLPYRGAFAARTSGIMPTYSILKDLEYRGTAVEQVGAGFNAFLLQDLLRGRFGFDGVVLSDWAIVNDCPQACLDNRPPNFFVGSWGAAMPWGVEQLSKTQRFAKAINAGVDQLGGSDEPSFVVAAVKAGLISPRRIDQAVHRLLVQKFRLGVFERPFVDPAAAERIVGKASFTRVGDAAQAASLTLLKNDKVLPTHAGGRAVYLSGVAPAAATALGFTVVDTPAKADLAVVRLSDPLSGPDVNGLDWTGNEADIKALRAAAATGVPTVAVPKLDRPLILTDVIRSADAVLADYGVSDRVLLETVIGKRAPGGRLPFELPSSPAAVAAQRSDVPDDSAHPLFRRGFGLRY